jgi:ferredoxin--NADP+ reductase
MSGCGPGDSALRVAIVGSGPAGLYAAVELLDRHAGACVEMFERLPVPGGLARYGVAPDHAERRHVCNFYARLAMASGRYRLHANVDVGRHIYHAELLEHFHAVIHASGASSDRRLGIPGEELPGSHAATEFVAWYNGHPDHADRRFDLQHERAVVVGNGNVALDLARMLLMPGARLAATDIAEHALYALTASRIREVVILGRRGPAQAAFTAPELLELGQLEDVDLVIDCPPELLVDDPATAHPLRMKLLREHARRRPTGGTRRLVLRFLSSPDEILGRERVENVRVVRNRLVLARDGSLRAEATGEAEIMPTGLVLRSVGYRGMPVPALPFDAAAGVVPSREGRVCDPATSEPLSGTYVAGWIKRGPSGVIGTNRFCSQQTVAALLDDAATGRLRDPRRSMRDFDRLLAERQPSPIDYGAWKRIDREERRRGTLHGRPRVKLSHWPELLLAAQ